MRLRGLTGARDEFHLAAIVQNLKTMALRLGHPPARRLRRSLATRLSCSPVRRRCPARNKRKTFPQTATPNSKAFFDSIDPLRKWSALGASAINLRTVPRAL